MWRQEGRFKNQISFRVIISTVLEVNWPENFTPRNFSSHGKFFWWKIPPPQQKNPPSLKCLYTSQYQILYVKNGQISQLTALSPGAVGGGVMLSLKALLLELSTTLNKTNIQNKNLFGHLKKPLELLMSDRVRFLSIF